ncbi:hypothetical protein [Gordonia sp. 'Campus']|uniref:hypothetical protein n=1 Tax=Gordonia sp. 'Campus' TaxID=2915824 RepID=UPI001EE42F46|nr:hypothetical protein [Gordonia sp. 'Campus']
MKTRFRRISAGVAFGAAAIAGAALAPAASAAPTDVTASPTVSGNTVSLTVTNNAAKRIGCEIFGVRAGDAPSQVVFGYQTPEELGALISPGSSKSVPLRISQGTPPAPTGSTTIPDGTYDVYWGCTTITLPPGTRANEQFWGTNPPLTAMTPTADPIRVTVPGGETTTPAPKPENPSIPDLPSIPGLPPIPQIPGVELPEEICAISSCAPVR